MITKKWERHKAVAFPFFMCGYMLIFRGEIAKFVLMV